MTNNSNRIQILDEVKDTIISAYESGDSCAMIAERYGVASSTIWERLKEWGVELRRRRVRYNQTLDEAKDAIISAYESGDSLTTLANQYGISRTTIRSRLKEWGVELRRRRVDYNQALDEAKDAIISAYESGDSLTTLAERYGVASSTIWSRLKEWGVELRRRRVDYNQTLDEVKDAIISAYESGDSLATIAERYGVSHSTIQRRLREWGVELRLPSRHYKPRQK